MPAAAVTIKIHANSEDIFDLIHDYSRRLDWDPFLREASLLGGAESAGVGVVSRCVARKSVGGAAMNTKYVSFTRPTVAAVLMTDGPILFGMFAASIRQKQVGPDAVEVTYRYQFRAHPRVLAFIIEPIVNWVLKRETRGRLAALKAHLE